MTIRHSMLDALDALDGQGLVTVDELQEAMREPNRKRVLDNAKQAIKEGLIARERDDITGQPTYRITPAGQTRLQICRITGNGKSAAENRAADAARSQAAKTKAAQQVDAEIMAMIKGIRAALGDDSIIVPDLANAVASALAKAREEAHGYALLIDEIKEAMGLPPDCDMGDLAEHARVTRWADDIVAGRPAPDAAQVGYICVLADDSMKIHPTLDDAKKEAEISITEEAGPHVIHVCEIHETAEIAVTWRKAA